MKIRTWSVLAILLSPVVASAQTGVGRPAPQTPVLENTQAFEGAYALSFGLLDACGDKRAGDIFRRALVAKVAECPFSDRAKSAFTDKVRKIEDQVRGVTFACEHSASRNTPAYQEALRKLDDYDAGRTGVDEIIPDRCDVAPGGM
jgi:hypothetical protein